MTQTTMKFTDRRLLLSLMTTPLFLLTYYYAAHPLIARSPLESRLRETPRDPVSVRASRIAICLVGGARRFELTGPSIVKNLLSEYPNADLFLHSPFDNNSYKFLLLKDAPRIAAVKIFTARRIAETGLLRHTLSTSGSPNGIQGLLQYFNLVEGCLSMIDSHEARHNLTYKWIVRTRVDSYWSGRLEESAFRLGEYVVPLGSKFGGYNDRMGVGDRPSSRAALSRLSLLPSIDAAGYRGLNSESAFKAQLVVSGVLSAEAALPFCVLSDRRYEFPPRRYGVPVASMGSAGPLNGVKCRPCAAACAGKCVEDVGGAVDQGWSLPQWSEGRLELCNASGPWEEGWERGFDKVAGKKAAEARRRVGTVDRAGCVRELSELKERAVSWDAPPAEEMCRLGLMGIRR